MNRLARKQPVPLRDEPADLVQSPLNALGIDNNVSSEVVFVRSISTPDLDAIVSGAALDKQRLVRVDAHRLDDRPLGNGDPTIVSSFDLDFALCAKFFDFVVQILALSKTARKKYGLPAS